MIKFQTTLTQFEFETLLKIANEANKEGKLQWSMTDAILENTQVIYEPKNEGA